MIKCKIKAKAVKEYIHDMFTENGHLNYQIIVTMMFPPFSLAILFMTIEDIAKILFGRPCCNYDYVGYIKRELRYDFIEQAKSWQNIKQKKQPRLSKRKQIKRAISVMDFKRRLIENEKSIYS